MGCSLPQDGIDETVSQTPPLVHAVIVVGHGVAGTAIVPLSDVPGERQGPRRPIQVTSAVLSPIGQALVHGIRCLRGTEALGIKFAAGQFQRGIVFFVLGIADGRQKISVSPGTTYVLGRASTGSINAANLLLSWLRRLRAAKTISCRQPSPKSYS